MDVMVKKGKQMAMPRVEGPRCLPTADDCTFGSNASCTCLERRRPHRKEVSDALLLLPYLTTTSTDNKVSQA